MIVAHPFHNWTCDGLCVWLSPLPHNLCILHYVLDCVPADERCTNV